jgi:protein FAM50
MGDSNQLPASGADARFTAPQKTVEDLIKSQTVGLVQLSDFRKRRAEAMETAKMSDVTSGSSTPKDGYVFLINDINNLTSQV